MIRNFRQKLTNGIEILLYYESDLESDHLYRVYVSIDVMYFSI